MAASTAIRNARPKQSWHLVPSKHKTAGRLSNGRPSEGRMSTETQARGWVSDQSQNGYGFFLFLSLFLSFSLSYFLSFPLSRAMGASMKFKWQIDNSLTCSLASRNAASRPPIPVVVGKFYSWEPNVAAADRPPPMETTKRTKTTSPTTRKDKSKCVTHLLLGATRVAAPNSVVSRSRGAKKAQAASGPTCFVQ